MAVSIPEQRQFLLHVHNAAIEAVSPKNTIPAHLLNLPQVEGHTLVLCLGKADMAEVVEETLLKMLGRDKFSGLVVTKHGHREHKGHLEFMTAGHPDPDIDSIRAADAIIEKIAQLRANGQKGNRILVFMSGGTSALIFKPAGDIPAKDGFAAGKAIVNAGLDIVDMNIIRRELSVLAGGGLAKIAGAETEIVSFAISDVPKDAPEVIGSGPSVPSPTGFPDARAAVAKGSVTLPASAAAFMDAGIGGSVSSDEADLWKNKFQYTVIASNHHALEAAATYARSQGVTPIIIPKRIGGDALQEAKDFAAIAKEITRTRMVNGQKIDGEILLLQGGEPIVKLPKDFSGEGGRMHHAALQFAIEMEKSGIPKEQQGVSLFFSTDGGDGRGNQRAAYTDPNTLTRGRDLGLNAVKHINEFRTVLPKSNWRFPSCRADRHQCV